MLLEPKVGAIGEARDVVHSKFLFENELNSFIQKVALTAETKVSRHLNRVLRKTFAQYRRKLTSLLLTRLVEKNFSFRHCNRLLLLKCISREVVNESSMNEEESMDVDEDRSADSNNQFLADKHPEVEIYLSLLVLIYVLGLKRIESAILLSKILVDRLENWNRRTLDPLSAKVFFYYSRSYELGDRLSQIRNRLFALYRTATLHHNFDGQTALLNLLLRNFLKYNLYDQAENLVSKAEFKESFASSNELARYYYYQGCIKIIDPDKYRLAHEYLQQALRKAPNVIARGFRVAVTKLICIVQLLLGDIPERSLFRQKGLSVALRPYLQLTALVRHGELLSFQQYVEENAHIFSRDKTLSLIHRMRNNVIKTGLRRINISYSRICFKEICHKLELDSIEDAEFIIAKAIKEGIIDVRIDRTVGFIASNPTVDVYSTNEPQEQFHARIQFFLDIHNDAMKAMRYSPKSEKIDDDLLNTKDEDELTAEFEDEFF